MCYIVDIKKFNQGIDKNSKIAEWGKLGGCGDIKEIPTIWWS